MEDVIYYIGTKGSSEELLEVSHLEKRRPGGWEAPTGFIELDEMDEVHTARVGWYSVYTTDPHLGRQLIRERALRDLAACEGALRALQKSTESS